MPYFNVSSPNRRVTVELADPKVVQPLPFTEILRRFIRRDVIVPCISERACVPRCQVDHEPFLQKLADLFVRLISVLTMLNSGLLSIAVYLLKQGLSFSSIGAGFSNRPTFPIDPRLATETRHFQVAHLESSALNQHRIVAILCMIGEHRVT